MSCVQILFVCCPYTYLYDVSKLLENWFSSSEQRRMVFVLLILNANILALLELVHSKVFI